MVLQQTISKLQDQLRYVLSFLRIIDPHDGLVSLTNVALIVVLIKLAMTPVLNFVDIGGLFIALVSYQSKKMINKEIPLQSQVTEMAEKLKKVADKINVEVKDE